MELWRFCRFAILLVLCVDGHFTNVQQASKFAAQNEDSLNVSFLETTSKKKYGAYISGVAFFLFTFVYVVFVARYISDGAKRSNPNRNPILGYWGCIFTMVVILICSVAVMNQILRRRINHGIILGSDGVCAVLVFVGMLQSVVATTLIETYFSGATPWVSISLMTIWIGFLIYVGATPGRRCFDEATLDTDAEKRKFCLDIDPSSHPGCQASEDHHALSLTAHLLRGITSGLPQPVDGAYEDEATRERKSKKELRGKKYEIDENAREVHRLCKKTCGICSDGSVDQRGGISELLTPLIGNLALIWGFAIIYLVFRADFGTQITNFTDALYFSIISHTTIGYGDINGNTSPVARALVNFQVLFVYFIWGATLYSLMREFSTESSANIILAKLRALNGQRSETRYQPSRFISQPKHEHSK